MTDQDCRGIIARGWLEKAEESFAEATILFDAKRLIGCVNRLYYSAFYAVSAALALEGKEYGKHTAVRASLHRDFVKTGKVPRSLGKAYDELFEDRQEGDYSPCTSFNQEDISRLILETRSLIDLFKSFLSVTIS